MVRPPAAASALLCVAAAGASSLSTGLMTTPPRPLSLFLKPPPLPIQTMIGGGAGTTPDSDFRRPSRPRRRRPHRSPSRFVVLAPPRSTRRYAVTGEGINPVPPTSSPPPPPPRLTPRKEELLTDDAIAGIANLVERRAEARGGGRYDEADAIRDDIEGIGISGAAMGWIPDGYGIVLRDIPRRLGGGTEWDVLPSILAPLEYIPGEETVVTNGEEGYPSSGLSGMSVLRLSHAAVGLATSAGERGEPTDRAVLDEILREAEARLRRTGASELRGRKAADAAFWFSLSGATDTTLFESLARVATDELLRFGARPSCRAKDVMHVVERLAAAGVTGDALRILCEAAADCLESKGYMGRNVSTGMEVTRTLRDGLFDLHCDRPLLWIWRFSIRQRKQRSFLKVAARRYDTEFRSVSTDSSLSVSRVEGAGSSGRYNWDSMFDDPTLPLVVDIGSGMGVSLHGLATLGEDHQPPKKSNKDLIHLDWSHCNFVGVDLSRLAVGYAEGITLRTGLSGRVQFCVDSAEIFLEEIRQNYPGDTRLIMIQFPTPFSLQGKDKQPADDKDGFSEEAQTERQRGNTQLPKHPFSGFMVTNNLLLSAYDTLKPSSGTLLIQSNCEDVAVMMRNLASKTGAFQCMHVLDKAVNLEGAGGRLPQRTEKWIRMGGERAEGEGWSAKPLLPRLGATETEIACFLEGTVRTDLSQEEMAGIMPQASFPENATLQRLVHWLTLFRTYYCLTQSCSFCLVS